jgi:hypothetical protein
MYRAGEGAREMTIWRWAAVAAVGVIACLIGFSSIPGIDACRPGGDPILAFEFVTNPADVAALFPAYCRESHAAAQHKGLLLDGIGFIPIYSAFLILSLIALRREGGGLAQRLSGLGVAAVLMAALLDQFEGVQLYRILESLPGTSSMIVLLMPAVRGKFLLLAIAVLLIGWLHFKRGGLRIPAGGLMITGAMWSIAGLVFNYEWVARGSALAWLVLIGTTFILAAKNRLATQD